MKLLFAPAILCLGLTQAAFAVQPNQFVCKSDAEDIDLVYSTTSSFGAPDMTLTIDGNDALRGEAGDNLVALQSANTVFGQLATAIVTRRHIMDAPSLTYGVFIPFVDLGTNGQVSFVSQLLEGYSGGFRPQTSPAQLVTKAIKLNCVGSKVFF